MSRLICVVAEDLHVSATVVNCHAQDVEALHASADAQIEAAQPGLMGLSAAAIAEKAATWQGVTQALCAQLADHSAAFRTSALDYQTTDDHNAGAVGQIGAGVWGSTRG